MGNLGEVIGNQLTAGDCPQPLILDFQEEREGATSCTTSGTWDDVDGSDST